MKKSNKLKPILTATLLVLPSFLFLSPSQKSNARLLQTTKLSGLPTIKFNPKFNPPTNINLKMQVLPKFSSNKPSSTTSNSNKFVQAMKFKINTPTGIQMNKISISRSQSTASSTRTSGKLTVKKSRSLSQSTSLTNSIQLDDTPDTSIAQKLVLHLQKNGINPENPTKIQFSNSSSRLSSSEA